MPQKRETKKSKEKKTTVRDLKPRKDVKGGLLRANQPSRLSTPTGATRN
jgi:hypothetical protein